MTTVSPFYSKKHNCPICDVEFTTYRVRSRSAVPTIIDSDFCAHFKDKTVNPNHYSVSVCPECGYAFTEEFSANFPAGAKNMIKEKISKKWEKRSFDGERDSAKAIETFKLAILSASIKRESQVIMANLCLRLAWIYRIEEQVDQEERFLRLALDEYEKSYIESDFMKTSMTELRLLFMIGELNRRLKDYQKAIQYFSKITEHPNRNNELKMLNMAREQWGIAIEEYKKVKDKQ